MRNAVARPTSREEFRSALIDLIANGLSARRRGSVTRDIDGDTPLFESGLIDSLAIIDLIAYVEDATGRRIAPRQVHLRYFGTIDRICAAFWPDESEVSGGTR